MPLVIHTAAASSDATLAYAAAEASRFLAATNLALTFHIDSTLPPAAFAIDATATPATLRGADPSAVLAALYTLLERLGIFFDITGPIVPDRLNTTALAGYQVLIRPAVVRRGIRQHINFPMDISSYPLAEAIEYLRNLARLRFNHITFHSYPQQWYRCRWGEKPVVAGRFFYDQPHPVPEHPVITPALRNKKWFCIPEFEAIFEQPEERSAAAIGFLQSLMHEAKRLGFTIQFSFEARNDPDTLAIVRHILETYPLIDTLEFITQECGASWGPSTLARDEAARLIATYFPGALEDAEIQSALAPGLGQLPLQLQELAHHLAVIKSLRATPATAPRPTLALGIYASDHATLRILLALLRRFAPPDTSLAFLPAHAARAAADSVRAMAPRPEDLRRTTLYSWIEFDGTMYLQQNGLVGIRNLLAFTAAALPGESLPAVAFNHWRTAENRLCARYAAEACLYGPVDPHAFTLRFAGTLGIMPPATFAAAMQRLDDVDTQARNELPNVGFCYEGCWREPGLGVTIRYKTPVVRDVMARYESIAADLTACLTTSTTAAARDVLSFLLNRVECSILHLRAIERLSELQPLYHESTMTPAQHAWSRRLCDEALAWSEEYMAHHARMLPDRGCEGTLISYYHTLPVTIHRLRNLFHDPAATPSSAPVSPTTHPTADAPPPPAI